MKMMMKSSKNKEAYKVNLLAQIQQTEADIKNWDEIKKFTSIYLYESAIPLFKKRKALGY